MNWNKIAIFDHFWGTVPYTGSFQDLLFSDLSFLLISGFVHFVFFSAFKYHLTSKLLLRSCISLNHEIFYLFYFCLVWFSIYKIVNLICIFLHFFKKIIDAIIWCWWFIKILKSENQFANLVKLRSMKNYSPRLGHPVKKNNTDFLVVTIISRFLY